VGDKRGINREGNKEREMKKGQREVAICIGSDRSLPALSNHSQADPNLNGKLLMRYA